MATNGAAIASLRRTARSCAAPFACHASQRSSKLEEAGGTVLSAVVTVKTSGVGGSEGSLDMQPTQQGFGEGWAGMAEGSEKQEPRSYADWDYATAPFVRLTAPVPRCLRRLAVFVGCDESIQIFGELA
jgi:hypothetical protein